MVTELLCNFLSIASLMLQEGKCKPYETLLTNAIKDLLIVSEWVKTLHNFNGNGKKDTTHVISEDRRICPRFKTAVSARINGQEYRITDISLTGCFIETEVSYPVSTIIMAIILICGLEISVTAQVAHSTDTGIGVKFKVIDRATELNFYSIMSDFFMEPFGSPRK